MRGIVGRPGRWADASAVGGGWWNCAASAATPAASAEHEDVGPAARRRQSALRIYLRTRLLEHGTSVDRGVAGHSALGPETSPTRRPLPERQADWQQEREASPASAPPGARRQQPQRPQRQ